MRLTSAMQQPEPSQEEMEWLQICRLNKGKQQSIFFELSFQLNIKKKTDNLMVELSRILRKDIHPVILNLAGEEILRQIFLKGKCILVNNKKKLVRYKMTTFARIADFSYYKKRMQSGLIRNVMEG